MYKNKTIVALYVVIFFI